MEALLTHCSSIFADHGSLYLAFFLGGLTGGFTHCLSMCGPFVSCERMCASKACSKLDAISAASGLKCHLGRMTTYGALGFFVALLSKQIATTDWWPVVSSLMLASAGGLFLISCLRSCLHKASKQQTGFTYIRGVLLGFMPCGLLYAALMMAATLAHPISAMVAMWIFTIGTIPALLIASGGAELLSRKWQHATQNVGRVMMAFNGLTLLVIAARSMR
jgi:sulfite exporter TauE/SafE